MKNAVYSLLIVSFSYHNLISQVDINTAIASRLMSNPDFARRDVGKGFMVHFELVALNFHFEQLPDVKYYLDSASYVPDEVVKKEYYIPNCTNSEQTLDQDFSLSYSLSKGIQISNSIVRVSNLSFSIKVPFINDLGEIKLGNEETETITLESSSSKSEQTTTEEKRSFSLKIKPNSLQLLSLSSTVGTVRVPFDAKFKINGTATIKYVLEEHPPFAGGSTITEIRLDTPGLMDRDFNFSGYITSQNSSKMIILFDERETKASDCKLLGPDKLTVGQIVPKLHGISTNVIHTTAKGAAK